MKKMVLLLIFSCLLIGCQSSEYYKVKKQYQIDYSKSMEYFESDPELSLDYWNRSIQDQEQMDILRRWTTIDFNYFPPIW
jgi:uncharacterized protein YcfL